MHGAASGSAPAPRAAQRAPPSSAQRAWKRGFLVFAGNQNGLRAFRKWLQGGLGQLVHQGGRNWVAGAKWRRHELGAHCIPREGELAAKPLHAQFTEFISAASSLLSSQPDTQPGAPCPHWLSRPPHTKVQVCTCLKQRLASRTCPPSAKALQVLSWAAPSGSAASLSYAFIHCKCLRESRGRPAAEQPLLPPPPLPPPRVRRCSTTQPPTTLAGHHPSTGQHSLA